MQYFIVIVLVSAVAVGLSIVPNRANLRGRFIGWMLLLWPIGLLLRFEYFTWISGVFMIVGAAVLIRYIRRKGT